MAVLTGVTNRPQGGGEGGCCACRGAHVKHTCAKARPPGAVCDTRYTSVTDRVVAHCGVCVSRGVPGAVMRLNSYLRAADQVQAGDIWHAQPWMVGGDMSLDSDVILALLATRFHQCEVFYF